MKTMADGELHDGGSTSFTLVFLLISERVALLGGFTHAANILPAGYEFEADGSAIS
jgi:hypothetical protein